MDQGKGWKKRWQLGPLALVTGFVFVLSACGGTGSQAASSDPTNSAGMSGNTSSATMGNMCDPLVKVLLSEKLTPGKPDQYIFSPSNVAIKVGEYVLYVNQTDAPHALITTPAAAMASSTIDENEAQLVQFTKAGTYKVESKNAVHRGTMQVTVATASNTTCGIDTSKNIVTIKEDKSKGKANQYTASVSAISIQAGEAVTFVNQTNEDHKLVCTPPADSDISSTQIDKNETQLVLFPKAGIFACASVKHPDVKITVMVK